MQMQLEIQESGHCGRHINDEERNSGKKTTNGCKGKVCTRKDDSMKKRGKGPVVRKGIPVKALG